MVGEPLFSPPLYLTFAHIYLFFIMLWFCRKNHIYRYYVQQKQKGKLHG